MGAGKCRGKTGCGSKSKGSVVSIRSGAQQHLPITMPQKKTVAGLGAFCLLKEVLFNLQIDALIGEWRHARHFLKLFIEI